MLRLTEIRLPIDHHEEALRAEILDRLGIPGNALVSYTIFRRSHDARKKNAIVFTYT
ncbi:MAG: FAD-dependent oxidoreductase, partial [Oxalobacter sp.]|nr:FAD-dependent oxidoreductase [Oxalobacter sp.]